MASAGGSPRPVVGRETFSLGGRTMTAEKLDWCWKLTRGVHVVETHDLPRGIDDLLGKSIRNTELVIEILEWQAGVR
jgi:hypothetical protein